MFEIIASLVTVSFGLLAGMFYEAWRDAKQELKLYRESTEHEMTAIKGHIKRGAFGTELGTPVYTIVDRDILNRIDRHIGVR